ncbi:MAG: hypothetical protein AMS14_04000 [Planctomycetes bacterium DG_20]|nr:MAG: hypothetical protein AMS14_04000 [Planctomycetes bacterium DG_20]
MTRLEDLPTSGGQGMASGTPAPLPLAAHPVAVSKETAPETSLSVARLAWPAVEESGESPPPAADPTATVLMVSDETAARPADSHGWASQPCPTPLASATAPWSPAASDSAADTDLAADGGLVDLLAGPALEVPLGA